MKSTYKVLVLSFITFVLMITTQAQQFVVGAYTDKSRYGIYLYKFNYPKNQIEEVNKYVISNSSYVIYSKKKKVLYAVSEQKAPFAQITAFKVDYSFSTLQTIGTITLNNGSDPCHLALNKEENLLFISNYSSGNFVVYELDKDGGFKDIIDEIGYVDSLDTSKISHVHSIITSKKSNNFWVVDLGLDNLTTFNYDFKNKQINFVSAYNTKPKSGPRHCVLNTAEDKLYVLNELDGTVEVLKKMKNIFISIQKIASDTTKNKKEIYKASADIQFSENQKFLYTSNRNTSNSISVFAVAPDGKLKLIQNKTVGKHPRSFTMSPNENLIFVACRDENMIEVYERDLTTGLIGKKRLTQKVPRPAFVKFYDF